MNMQLQWSKKALINFYKILIFALTLSSVVLYSADANIDSRNMANDNHNSFSHRIKNLEPQTMFLLAIGFLGLAGISRRRFKR